MINQISFRVPGQPVTWKRTATFGGRRITPKAQREYQAKVKACALALIGSRLWPLSGRFQVVIEAVRSDHRPFDLDNLCKNVLDSLNGALWADDSQVDALHAYRWQPSKLNPYVNVTVTRLGA